MNYWIFQGNPDAYFFDSSVDQTRLNNWLVKKHTNKIKEGDKAIIWLCGPASGCYGLADILTNPYQVKDKSEDLNLWNVENVTGKRHQIDDKITMRVDIRLTHNLFTNGKPLLKGRLPITLGPLETLRQRGFIQGTNFRANMEQYETILKLIESID